MKDIMLKITGKMVTHDDGEEKHEELIEFITSGQLYNRGNATFIKYEETELSGTEGCTTSLVISKDKVRMRRFGDPMRTDTVMEFRKGKRYRGMYETPFGPINMELLTNDVTALEDAGDGKQKLYIDYNISLRGLTESRNRLELEIIHKNQRRI